MWREKALRFLGCYLRNLGRVSAAISYYFGGGVFFFAHAE
jgi:hypothetical protein